MATAACEPPLFIKSYFADSVEDTLDRARSELGAEALLLHHREAPPEARHLGAFEVVFGARHLDSGLKRSATSPRIPPTIQSRGQRQAAASESPMTPAPGAPLRIRIRASIADHLIENGVAPVLAAEIEATVIRRRRTRSVVQIGRPLAKPRTADLVSDTIAELDKRFAVAPAIGDRCALIGPAGAGKTTTLIKLAIARGLAFGREVRLISVADSRIGATAQFQKYASILGVPSSIARSVSELEDDIDSTPRNTLLLIDTPGQTKLTLENSGLELAALLRRRQDIDTHLVLTATARERDLGRITDRFAVFNPAKLLFTRLDETDATGSIFSEAARTSMPISFLAAGQMVPEDLEPATKDRVTRALARELPESLAADI